jgi:hypothetical protein
MINSQFRHLPFLIGVACTVLVCGAVAGQEDQAFRATLVWGTNTPKPSDAQLQPVAPDVARKLGTLPFKWEHYYTVESKRFQVASGGRKTVKMSDQCEIVVKPVDKQTVELSLRGEGKRVGKVTQKLPPDDMLVVGGNAENFTAWFVVLRRDD